jgi:hypothetical protein
MSSYIPIASQTLGSSASSVTFSSIPTTLNGKTLRDLVLVCNMIGTSTGGGLFMRINSDTGSNYSRVIADGTGSGVLSNSGTTTSFFTMWGSQEVSGSTSTSIFQLLDYSVTDKHKAILARSNNVVDSGVSMAAGRWANTAAVNALLISLFSNQFAAGSTFSLYGIEG